MEACTPLNLSQKSYSIPTPRNNVSCTQQSPVSFTSLLAACEGPPTYVDTPPPSLNWSWHMPSTPEPGNSVATPQSVISAIQRPMLSVATQQHQVVTATAPRQQAAANPSTTLQQQQSLQPGTPGQWHTSGASNQSAVTPQQKRVSATPWKVTAGTLQEQMTSPNTPQQQQSTITSNRQRDIAPKTQQQPVAATPYQWHVPVTPRQQVQAAGAQQLQAAPITQRLETTTANRPQATATARQLFTPGTTVKQRQPIFAAPLPYQTPATTSFNGSSKTLVTPGLHTPVYTAMSTNLQAPLGAMHYTPLPPLFNSPLTASPLPNSPLGCSPLTTLPQSVSPITSPHQFLPPARQPCFNHPSLQVKVYLFSKFLKAS